MYQQVEGGLSIFVLKAAALQQLDFCQQLLRLLTFGGQVDAYLPGALDDVGPPL